MAFTTSSKVHSITNDIFIELDKFTIYNYTEACKTLTHNIYDLTLKELVHLLISFRRLNELPINDKIRNYCYKKIIQLIVSINNLDDADTHPIGQDLSIYTYASKAQSVLNVKQLTEQITDMGIDDFSTNFKYFVVNTLKLGYDRIIPPLSGTIIHNTTKNRNWFRLQVTFDDWKKNITEMLNVEAFSIGLVEIYIISEEEQIIEVYYTNNKLQQCMYFLENCAYVKNIIFYSNLKLFKEKCNDTLSVLSNFVKFYYCYSTKEANFNITNTEQLKIFNRIFLNSILLYYKSNINIANTAFTAAPIASLSGNNPSKVIKAKSKMMEPLTSYEQLLLENNPDIDLRDTAMSKESITAKNRHAIYGLSQDRDNRIILGQSLVGGVNIHELVIHQD